MPHPSPLPDRVPAAALDRAGSLIENVNVMMISLEAHFDRHLDPDRLARAMELMFDAEPVLGCRWVPDPWRPWWERLPRPIDEAFLVAADDASFESFATEPLEATVGPQLGACLWPAPDGDRLLVKIGHFCADAGALKEVAETLASIYRRLADDPRYEPEPNLAGSRGIELVMRHVPWSARPRIALNGMRASRRLLFGPPSTRLPMTNGPVTGAPRFVLRHVGRERVERLAAWGRARGATLNDLVVTATLRALCVVGDRSAPSQLGLVTTADLRRYIPGGRGAGPTNLSGLDLMSLGVPPELDEGFCGLLARVVAFTRARKASWIGLNDVVTLLPALGWWPYGWLSRFTRVLVRLANRARRIPHGMTNMGPISAAAVDFDGPPRRAFLRVPPTRPPNFALGVSGHAGELTTSTGWFPGTTPEGLVDRFFDVMIAELEAVGGGLATGDRRPATGNRRSAADGQQARWYAVGGREGHVGKHNEPKELKTVAEVERMLVAGDRGPTYCVHDDVEFAVEWRRPPASIPKVMKFWIAVREPEARQFDGLYATIALPEPVPSDLLLRTQARPPEADESLEACFQIEASDPEALRKYLAGGLGAVLMRLNRRRLVEMSDTELTVGPLEGEKDSASALVELLAALPRPPADAVELPDFDEAVKRDGGTVEVAELEGEVSAEMVCGALEAEGVPCRMMGGRGAGVFPSVGMGPVVRILVPKSFAKQAEAVMKALDASAPAEETEEEEEK